MRDPPSLYRLAVRLGEWADTKSPSRRPGPPAAPRSAAAPPYGINAMRPTGFRLAVALVAASAALPPLAASAASMDPFAEQLQTEQALNRAISLYRAGRLEEARAAADAYLSFNPTSARGHEVLAAILGSEGDLAAAIEAIEAALRLDPELASAHTNRAVLLLDLGREDDAIAALRRAVELQPDLYEAHAKLGLLLEARGDLDGAVHHFERVADGPDGLTPGVRVNLGAIYNARGRFEDTIRMLSLWQRDRDVTPALHRVLAEAMLGADRGEAALRQYRFAIEGAGHEDPRTLLGLGVAHRRLGDFDEAQAVFDDLAARFPEAPAPLTQMAELQLARGDHPGAVERFRQAIALADAPAEIEHRLAEAMIDADEFEEADAIYTAMLERDGPSPRLLLARPQVAIIAGDLETGLARTREAVEAYPEIPLGWARLGALLRSMDRDAEALEVAERGLDRHPGESLLLRIAATAARDVGEMRRAIAYGRQIIEQNPDDVGDRFIFATLLDKAREDRQALSLYRSVVENQRDNWAAMNNLALVLERNDKASEGLIYARRALQMQPDNPAVKHTMAWILFGNGRVSEAERLMAEAAEALPGIGEVRLHYGMILHARRKLTDARRELTEGLRLSPDHEDAPEARDLLDSI